MRPNLNISLPTSWTLDLLLPPEVPSLKNVFFFFHIYLFVCVCMGMPVCGHLRTT